MIQYSKGLDADDEKIRIREESMRKPNFRKDYAEYIKKYEASREYVPRGYHFVPSGPGEVLKLCGPFYIESEESVRLRNEFEKKYPCFDYVAPCEAWNMWAAEVRKAMKAEQKGDKAWESKSTPVEDNAEKPRGSFKKARILEFLLPLVTRKKRKSL